MDNTMFKELLESVEQMDAIVQGKQKPARQFEYPELEVKAIREKTGLSQGRTIHHFIGKQGIIPWFLGDRPFQGIAHKLG